LQDPYVGSGIQREPVHKPVPNRHHKTYLDKTALWKFQGKKDQDIGDRLFTIERYQKKTYLARVYGILSEETKIDTAVDYLRDGPLSVYKDLAKKRTQVTWYELSWALKENFEPFEQENLAEEKLRNLKQRGNVESYIYEFNDLVCKTNLSEKEKVKIFIEGLKDRNQVGYEKPGTLSHVKIHTNKKNYLKEHGPLLLKYQ